MYKVHQQAEDGQQQQKFTSLFLTTIKQFPGFVAAMICHVAGRLCCLR